MSFSRARALALALAALVGLPSLWVGFFADDYFHLGILRGVFPVAGRYDLFRFASGDPTRNAAWIQHGPYPWWTLPEIKISFFRPLSSALRVWEEDLFPGQAVVSHLHSVLWYLALVAVVAALLRPLLPPSWVALALGVFALDVSHFIPVVWVANRNALVSAMPALLAMHLHLRAREGGSRWAVPLSTLAWATALAGGESALAAFGYLFAYELLGARDALRRRLVALLPATLLGTLYLVLYRFSHSGAFGSGTYLDPTAQPLAYAKVAGPRVLALLAGGLLKAPSELGNRGVPGLALAALGALALWGFARGYRRIAPNLPPDSLRHVRWLALGALLALFPVASTFPSNRLLLIFSVGGAAVVSGFLLYGGRGPIVALLAVAHLALAPVSWGLSYHVAHAAVRYGETVSRYAVLEGSELPRQRVLVLVPPDPLVGLYPAMMRRVANRSVPLAWWIISLAPHDHLFTRTGLDSFELALREGRFLRSEFEQLFRGLDFPFHPGQRVELEGLRVEVLEVDEQGPVKLRFVLDRPLEDPSLLLLSWEDGALRRYTPPSVGASEWLRYQPSIPFLP
jgi:hypothetical protein